jgi:hypothetical protein
MTNVRVNTVMESDLLAAVDAYARERREDRSTAIRQLVAFALRETHTREALDQVKAGRMTLREFADSLDLDAWQAHDLLAAEGISTVALEETASALAGLVAKAGGTGARARPR